MPLERNTIRQIYSVRELDQAFTRIFCAEGDENDPGTWIFRRNYTKRSAKASIAQYKSWGTEAIADVPLDNGGNVDQKGFEEGIRGIWTKIDPANIKETLVYIG